MMNDKYWFIIIFFYLFVFIHSSGQKKICRTKILYLYFMFINCGRIGKYQIVDTDFQYSKMISDTNVDMTLIYI